MENKIYGRWKTLSSAIELEGNLIVDEEKRKLFLELLIPDPGDGGPTAGFERGTVFPLIQGSLFGGGSILLHNCTCLGTSGFLGDVLQLIHCEYGFYGLRIEEEYQFRFSEICVTYDGMLEWTHLCRFEQRFDEDRHLSLHWFGEENITLKVSNDLNIDFSPSVSSNRGMFDPDAIMTQSVVVRFEYAQEVEWGRFLEDLKKVKYLNSFALRAQIHVTEIKYCDPSLKKKNIIDSKKTKHILPRSVLMGLNPTTEVNTLKGRGFFSLFGLKDGVQNGAIEKWFDIFETLEPVLDLLFSAIEGRANSEILCFLNYVQALETFHARFVANDVREVTSQVRHFKEEHIKKHHSNSIDFLIKSDQIYAKSVHLYTRLAYLSYDCGEYPWRFSDYLGKEKEYLTKIVDSRNYYTHYSQGKKAKAFRETELYEVNCHLASLLQYHILKILGFDSQYALEKCM